MLEEIQIDTFYILATFWFAVILIVIFSIDWNVYPVHWVVMVSICILVFLLHLYCICLKLGVGKDWFNA